MTSMKDFGIWLAKQVFVLRTPDKDIIETVMSRYQTQDVLWIKQQIQAVRDNASLYRELAKRE